MVAHRYKANVVGPLDFPLNFHWRQDGHHNSLFAHS